jgi:DNA-binding transcriptional LysR family regulator
LILALVLDSSVPEQLSVFPLQEDPFVAVIHCDDPLAASAHLPWKQLVGRDIAVFSKVSSAWLARSLKAIVYRCRHVIRWTISKRCTAWCAPDWPWRYPQLYTTHLQDPQLKVVHLQQPALARTVALMRAPQPLPTLIESCFTLMVETLRHTEG